MQKVVDLWDGHAVIPDFERSECAPQHPSSRDVKEFESRGSNGGERKNNIKTVMRRWIWLGPD